MDRKAGRRRMLPQALAGAGIVYGILLLLSSTTWWAHGDYDFRPEDLCRENLRKLDPALSRYRMEHGGKLPARLGELVPRYTTSEAIHCPWYRTAAYDLSPPGGRPLVQCMAHVTSYMKYWQPAFLRTVWVYERLRPTLVVGEGEVTMLWGARPVRVVRPFWVSAGLSRDEVRALGAAEDARAQ